MLYYLDAMRRRGIPDGRWEKAVRKAADNLVALQRADGSFPRKYREGGIFLLYS